MRKKQIKNAGKGNLIEKVKRKVRGTWVKKLYKTPLYMYCYISHWHSIFSKNIGTDGGSLYLAARPNPGAGIGHQMANWIAGYWFAEQFGLQFAHIPFSNSEWEEFLGFYQNEVTMKELRNSGFKVRRIPIFNEDNIDEVIGIEKIIDSYKGEKVVLLAEQDQFYQDQIGVTAAMQEKFFSAPARRQNRLIYNTENYNIAIHVRRGDIMQGDLQNDSNLLMRYQSNEYFVNALKTALEYLKDKNNIHIYFFSQGVKEDYAEFNEFNNIHFCLNMGAQDSFLHMVYADALITSKSGFSYTPALINKGIKFSPNDFWHSYPDSDNWILLDERGKQIDAS